METVGRGRGQSRRRAGVSPGRFVCRVRLGNWNISAGAIDRWWGPGWEGSLILSNNARPVPSIGIDRNEARPFSWPILQVARPVAPQHVHGATGRRPRLSACLAVRNAGRNRARCLRCRSPQAARRSGAARDGPAVSSTFGDLLTGNDNERGSGRGAGQSAGRIRRPLVVAGRARAGGALRPGDRRGRSGIPAVEVPRSVRCRSLGPVAGHVLAGARSSTPIRPVISRHRHPSSVVPTRTTSTPAGTGIVVGPWGTRSMRTANPLASACCWSRPRGGTGTCWPATSS